jgi:hypothetical protein
VSIYYLTASASLRSSIFEVVSSVETMPGMRSPWDAEASRHWLTFVSCHSWIASAVAPGHLSPLRRRIASDLPFKPESIQFILQRIFVESPIQSPAAKTVWGKYRPLFWQMGARGSIVVMALCYKPEGRGLETWWGEWISSIYIILPAALGTGVMLLRSKVRPVRRADKLGAICEPIL